MPERQERKRRRPWHFRRDAKHVGRVRIKLAELLTEALKAEHIPWKCREVEPDDLDPNQGYWRIDHRADVMRWTGTVYVQLAEDAPWRGMPIGSWHTMSELIRKGVEVKIDGFTLEAIPH